MAGEGRLTVLSTSFYLLTLAVAAGTILGLLHLRGGGAPRPPVAAGIAHGLIGTLGLALLWPVAQGPARGVAAGAGSFGPVAAWLLAVALATGVTVLIRRRGQPAILMAIHAGIAITGYLLLVAWYSVG